MKKYIFKENVKKIVHKDLRVLEICELKVFFTRKFFGVCPTFYFLKSCFPKFLIHLLSFMSVCTIYFQFASVLPFFREFTFLNVSFFCWRLCLFGHHGERSSCVHLSFSGSFLLCTTLTDFFLKGMLFHVIKFSRAAVLTLSSPCLFCTKRQSIFWRSLYFYLTALHNLFFSVFGFEYLEAYL